MNWITLSHIGQLAEIELKSKEKPQVIFKHSTRCSISSMVKSRLDNAANVPSGADFYFLDLIAHRDISNAIAEKFGVQHESPQVLVIENGKSVYTESHNGIRIEDIAEAL